MGDGGRDGGDRVRSHRWTRPRRAGRRGRPRSGGQEQAGVVCPRWARLPDRGAKAPADADQGLSSDQARSPRRGCHPARQQGALQRRRAGLHASDSGCARGASDLQPGAVGWQRRRRHPGVPPKRRPADHDGHGRVGPPGRISRLRPATGLDGHGAASRAGGHRAGQLRRPVGRVLQRQRLLHLRPPAASHGGGARAGRRRRRLLPDQDRAVGCAHAHRLRARPQPTGSRSSSLRGVRCGHR